MNPSSVLDYLLEVSKRHKAGYLILIDPDRHTVETCVQLARQAEEAGVDGLLLGGSFLTVELDPIAEALLKEISVPLILFPGDAMHVTSHADAILYLSLISGRNANFLIGEQVKAAPLIKRYGLEAIPTGYMLIDSGCQTSVGFMSGTSPLPRDKFDLAWAHALAAQYLGMRLIYLEAGSGANLSVPSGMISAIRERLDLPIVVGGGLKTPEAAAEKVNAGANFIVTGTVFENESSSKALMKAFAAAIHG